MFEKKKIFKLKKFENFKKIVSEYKKSQQIEY